MMWCWWVIPFGMAAWQHPCRVSLHEHAAKLRGKRIALFATSGSSGMAASIGEAEALCSESEVVVRDAAAHLLVDGTDGEQGYIVVGSTRITTRNE